MLLLLLAWVPSAQAGTTLHVPDDAPTLDEALGQVVAGDTIALGSGTFTASVPVSVPLVGEGPTTVLSGAIGGEALLLRGLTLDGAGGRPLRCEGSSVTLIDVTVAGGGVGGDGDGGGVLFGDDCDVQLHRVVASGADLGGAKGDGGVVAGVDLRLTAVEVSMTGGRAVDGGAVHQVGGSLYASGVTLEDNVAIDDGGGLYLDGVIAGIVGGAWQGNTAGGQGGAADGRGGDITLIDLELRDNGSGSGAGGLYVDGTLHAEGVVAVGNGSGGAGAIGCTGGPCTVTDSRFEDNVGGSGGGLLVLGDGSLWVRNTFCGNEATGGFFAGYGGGVAANGNGSRGEGNLYVDNRSGFVGGGASIDGDIELAHEVFVANEADTQGSGAYVVFGYGTIRNSVFAVHPGPGAAIGDLFAGVTTTTNLFWSNDGGDVEQGTDPSDRNEDPMLPAVASATCDRAAYGPSAGSPLIDGGSGADDLDGTTADIGLQGGPTWNPTDADGDGVAAPRDCDDGDGAVGAQQLLFADDDGDGFGGYAAVGVGCPDGATVGRSGDCDDSAADVFPGAVERLDGVDQDCDGWIDEDAGVWYRDMDGDGFGDPEDAVAQSKAPPGYVADGTDCDDDDASVNPGADEVCDGSVDEDCDGLVDDQDDDVVGAPLWWRDVDGDTYGDVSELPVAACVAPDGSTGRGGDCDDAQARVNEGATEVCDPDDVDEDCNGLADDEDPGVTGTIPWGRDVDGDGYGGLAGSSCSVPADAVLDTSDCDDTDPTVNPGATEVCDPDDVDEDCDGWVDDADPSVQGQVEVPVDDDGDGWADPLRTELACDPNDLPRRDCDDRRGQVFPGAEDIPDDGVDQDCDGVDAVWLYGRGGCGCAAPSPAGPTAALGPLAMLLLLRRRE